MKRNLVLGTVFSAALAVGVSAQTTGAQTGQQSSEQKNQQVTVTGCLENADMAGGAAGTTGTGTTGTTGQSRSSSSAEFMLTHAKITSGGTGTAGTTGTGTTGTTGAMSSMNKFKLMGGNQQELREYLNSQVEIRGTLQREMDRSSGAATGTAQSQTQRKSEDENVQTIRVTSVKQVSKTCTGADR